MSFPIDTIVQVNIDRITQFPTRLGFGVPLIMDINTVQDVGAVDTFNSVDDMISAGFVLADEAVKAVSAHFGQSPRPVSVKVARREANVALVQNIAINGSDDGTYEVTINAIPFAFVASSSTPSDIEAGLIAAINAGGEPVTASPGGGDDFDLTADVAGVGFSAALTQNPNTNMVLSTTTPNVGAGSELSRINAADADFYFVGSTSRTEQDILQISAVVETLIKIYFFETDQADSKDLDAPTDTTSIFGQLKALARERTVGVWTKTSNLDNYPSQAWVGKNAPKDPGSLTWKFKNVNGVLTDDELTPTEKANILADLEVAANGKNGNTYTTVGGVAIFEEGTVFSREFIDIIRGTDFLSARIKEAVLGLLVSEDKVSFTNGGIAQVKNQIRKVLRLGVDQEILSDDPTPPTVTAPDITLIPVAERAARFLDGVEFEGFYAGAIHKVKIQGRLSV